MTRLLPKPQNMTDRTDWDTQMGQRYKKTAEHCFLWA